MRANDHVNSASCQPSNDGALLRVRSKATDAFDREWILREALAERAVMLFGEDGGRYEHSHLFAVIGDLEGGPNRQLGLAVADVAANQAVHRAGALHVRFQSAQ